jgi:L-Ala-D/L-Glu epimerase
MIRAFNFDLELIEPFAIARSTRSQSHNVIVNVDGGWGESAPIPFYGEDVASVGTFMDCVNATTLPDLDDIAEVEAVVERTASAAGHTSIQAAKAAIDIALYDRLAKKRGVRVCEMIGSPSASAEMVTSFTIGISSVDDMLRKVDAARHYRVLKIKLGRDLGHDLDVMKAIRRSVGDKTLRVDANCGWTLAEAQRALPVLADLGVEFVEQPLERGALADLGELKKQAPLPLFVDEDCVTAADLPALAGVADGVNIKLMKSGGISEARRMVALARSLGLRTMLGCMIESSVAITAAAHLGQQVDYLDLDGNLLVSNDPFDGARCDPAGVLTLREIPGLGVTLRPEYESHFAC